MDIVAQVAIAILACVGVFGIVYSVRRALILPLGEGEKITAVLCVQDGAPMLEHTVKGLVWLRKNYGINLYILIADEGLNEEGERIAKLLTQENENTAFLKTYGMGSLFGEVYERK
jgi:hypothetical protein